MYKSAKYCTHVLMNSLNGINRSKVLRLVSIFVVVVLCTNKKEFANYPADSF